MKRIQSSTILLACFSLVFASMMIQCTSGDSKSPQDKKIKEIVSTMTLEEKVQYLVGTGMFINLPDSIRRQFGRRDEAEEDTAYTNMVDRVRTYLPGAAGFMAEFPEKGVTSQVLADGPAGLRISPTREGDEHTYYCTAFPIATLLASTWDTELVYTVGEAMGNEVLEYGADVILGPGMNLQRDPLCGRNFEYYSEDPLVTGKMAASMVKGVQSNNVGTSIKHFAVNNQETNRMSVNVIVSERALREIYLRGFEIAVTEAQPWTVMSSYNKVNGPYTSESHDLLTKILRDDWGFEGYVMTDWGGGSDVVAQMEAGNDVIMPGRPQQIREIITAVKDSMLDESVLDRNVSRALRVMMKTPRYNKYPFSGASDLEAHAEIARQAAADGMVLLKNSESALPMDPAIKGVACFGNTSYDIISGGTGSGDVNEAYTISLFEGLGNGGYTPDAELAEVYNQYIEAEREKLPKPRNMFEAFMRGNVLLPEMSVSNDLAQQLAEKAEIALITIGRNAGEGGDRQAVEGDFYLTPVEKKMIRNVSDAFHTNNKKVIVVMNIAGVIETASWREFADAVLCAWQPGQEAGNAIVDVLSGAVNPSGKLAISFPMLYEDSPSVKNFPGQAVEMEGMEDDRPDQSGFSFMRRRPWEVVYEEDIYVGYRYYNTFDVPVAYEFGYGLSYTTFAYDNLELSSTDFTGELTVSIEVANTGDVAGREVVQVYASAPEVKLNKPEEELVAFGKTRLLEPGETETLSFIITTRDLASFDEATSTWTAEAGTYTIKIGASSKEIKASYDFTLEEALTAGMVSKALVPEREINRLTEK